MSVPRNFFAQSTTPYAAVCGAKTNLLELITRPKNKILCNGIN